ncbi:hypothetical protein [Okeania sp. KiyG1]|uniref:hypothetical protein n=1 Tax=Okeania sp. KiyG1 TaxID=2720165 RepID=UPI001F198B70|nr:hypothetical protein [Okeania sp. KiyG1]
MNTYYMRWGMGGWGDGGMGGWGDGEMGGWGDLRRESVDRIINIYCIIPSVISVCYK